MIQQENTTKQPDDRTRRHFLKGNPMLGLAGTFFTAKTVEAYAGSKSKATQDGNAMSQAGAPQPGTEQAGYKNAIRPFHVNIPEADLTDLREEVTATKWPENEKFTTNPLTNPTLQG